MLYCFENAEIYVEGKGIVHTSLSFNDTILDTEKALGAAKKIVLPKNCTVLPGFIDIHTHGSGGSDVMDGTTDALRTIADTLCKEGTTSFLATTMSEEENKVLRAVRNVASYVKTDAQSGARTLGIHLEGPCISEKFCGAQRPETIVLPTVDTIAKYVEAGQGFVKIVTLAPEKEGAMESIRYLSENGIVPSLGHCDAGFEDIKKAQTAGAKSVTHTYNAQKGLHHREIGTIGAAMLLDELNCEVIADTIHVSVPALKLLVKNKPKDKLTLITDAIRAKGCPEGISELGGQKVIVKNGEARIESGALAGSVLKMNDAIRNMVEKVGVPLTDAVDMATINPARLLNLDKEIGSIAVGKKADFTVIDANYQVILTVKDGQIIYER